jgi:hypothetical protein
MVGVGGSNNKIDEDGQTVAGQIEVEVEGVGLAEAAGAGKGGIVGPIGDAVIVVIVVKDIRGGVAVGIGADRGAKIGDEFAGDQVDIHQAGAGQAVEGAVAVAVGVERVEVPALAVFGETTDFASIADVVAVGVYFFGIGPYFVDFGPIRQAVGIAVAVDGGQVVSGFEVRD